MVNRVAFVLACALFNLAFEYSTRGINGFLRQPLLPPMLFGLYFAYYAMLEDLTSRRRLHNYQICLVACLYGLLVHAFATRTFFTGWVPLGINLGSLLFTELVWWYVLQAVVTLYFANRFSQRAWAQRRMGRAGWFLCLGYTGVALGALARNPALPPVAPLGWVAWGVLVCAVLVGLLVSLRRDPPKPFAEFETSRTLDVLALGSLGLFLAVGTFLTGDQIVAASSYVNRTARDVVVSWSVMLGVAYAIYRWRRGREIAL